MNASCERNGHSPRGGGGAQTTNYVTHGHHSYVASNETAALHKTTSSTPRHRHVALPFALKNYYDHCLLLPNTSTTLQTAVMATNPTAYVPHSIPRGDLGPGRKANVLCRINVNDPTLITLVNKLQDVFTTVGVRL